jgi:hypothetical protein
MSNWRLKWAMALLFAPLAALAQVQFPVTFATSANGLTQAERALITSHVQAAGERWVRQMAVSGARSIEVEIAVDDGIATGNGASVTTAFVAIVGGRNLFEQGAAAELKSGVDPNGATVDVRFAFSTNYLRNELWFDPDPLARVAPVPNNRTDAMSVMLHEFGHAFAYNGWAALSDGTPPATFWSPFDQWMTPGTTVIFNGPQSIATFGSSPDLTRNNLFHWGNVGLVTPTSRGSAPTVWRDGRPQPQPPRCEIVSMDADDAVALKRIGGPLIDELMNGVVFIRGNRYHISALDRAALADVGIPLPLFKDGFEPR